MKSLTIRKMTSEVSSEVLKETLINQVEPLFIDTINWEGFPLLPKVSVRPAFSEKEVILLFEVEEQQFRAVNTKSNDPVYEDSCVEFFFSPLNDGTYYNFEFNGLGTCLMGYGKDRNGRERLSSNVIEKIQVFSSLSQEPIPAQKGSYKWSLLVKIPFEVFIYHPVESLDGSRCRANFYKCGDQCPAPHYVSWSPIGTDQPDFHQYNFFGELQFKG